MTPEEFQERLHKSPRPVVVDFWAPWCAPCRAIDPLLKRLGQEYTGRVEVWKVNADEHPELLRQLKIYGIPTLISFRAGAEVARQVGVSSPQALVGLFEAALSGQAPPKVIAPLDRLLRLLAAAGVLWVAASGGFQGWYALLIAAAAGLAFSAVYDRCPIWQALAPRLKALLIRKTSG